MAHDPFSPALRAEIEALVARYEALARSHQEALAAAREHEVARLRQDLATLLADRERTRLAEADARAQLKASSDRCALLERDLADARRSLDQSAQRMEALQVEGRAAVEREREDARAARAALQSQLDEARRLLEEARAEARQRLAQVEDTLREVQQEAESLSGAFASEKSFVDACLRLDGTPLLDALRQAFGAEFSPSPATYAALKARRPDAVLAAAFKERGRLVAAAPLTSAERAPLAQLAQASGCELIEPDHGVRFSSSSMDKASTQPDPAEEGNVLACLMPGLRLAGTDGALVFPRVLVASG
jgi:hypothetical protein